MSVNIELRTLRAAFNVALRWDLIESNPFHNVQLINISEEQPLFFKKGDFQKLISIIKENWLKELMVFAVLTGMRRAEITNLRWQGVDIQRKVIHIQSNNNFRTKQGRRRTRPLNEVAFHLLQMRQVKSISEYVFTLNNQKISEGWLSHKFKYYIYESKLQNDKLHFHSLLQYMVNGSHVSFGG